MRNFTSYLVELAENSNDFKQFIDYVVSIIKTTVNQAKKIQVASTDYFIEDVVNFSSSSYRIIINNGIAEVSSLDFSGIQETSFELLETAIKLYNERLTPKFQDCKYNFPKAKQFATNNPRKIEETFIEMLKEAKDAFKNKAIVHGEVGESQVETLIQNLGYTEHKPKVKITINNRDSYVGENLKKGTYLSSKSYNIAPDFIIRFYSRDLLKLRKIFPNYSIQEIDNRKFLFSEVKTATSKNQAVKGTETKNKDVGSLLTRADKEKFLLGKEEKELLIKIFNLKTDYTVITPSGIRTKTFKEDLFNKSLYIEKVPTKTKQRTYNIKDSTGKTLLSIEKRNRAIISKNVILTDKIIKDIKELWKMFKIKWYGNLEKKSTDELRGAFVYYLIHTEQEIPSHIVKNSYELKIKMENLRDKIFKDKSKEGFKAKEEVFPLLESLLYDTFENILFETFEEMKCLL